MFRSAWQSALQSPRNASFTDFFREKIYWLIWMTFAGGNPLKQVDEAWE